MNDETLQLIVDSEDNYLEEENVFYIHPLRLNKVKCLADNQFVSCKILNSPIDTLTSMNFSYILRKLKPEATVEVAINQPITVMQEYDAKQIEANARLAGLEVNLKRSNTKVVVLSKPIKRDVEVIEIEVPASKRQSFRKNVTSTQEKTKKR